MRTACLSALAVIVVACAPGTAALRTACRHAGAAAVEQTTPGAALPRARRELRRPRRRLRAGRRARRPLRNPSDNTLAVGPESHRADRELADGDLHEEGQAVRHDRPVLYGPVTTNNVFKGFGGACEARNNGDAVVRYDQLADRWLIVMPIFCARCRCAGTSRRRQAAASRRARSVLGRPGQPGSARAALSSRRRSAAAAGRRRRPAQRRAGTRPPPDAGLLRDVLRHQHRRRSARPVLSLRVRAAALSRLSAPGGLARRLLRADQHRRRGRSRSTPASPIARRCSKGEPATEQCVVIDDVNFLNNADLDGKAAAASRRAEHHDGGRRHAAEEGSRGRRHLRRGSSTSTGRTRRRRSSTGPAKIARRAVSLPVRRPADELRAAAGHRPAARRAGRQDHGAARLPPRSATASRSSPCTR